MRRNARDIAHHKADAIRDEIDAKKKKLSYGAKIVRWPSDNDNYTGFVFGSQGRAWYCQGCRLFTIPEAYAHWNAVDHAYCLLTQRSSAPRFRERYNRARGTLAALYNAWRYAKRKGWKVDV